MKSFRWLRGWVPQSLIQSEFDSIKQHKEAYNKCGACKKSTEKCTHVKTQTTKESLKELLRKRTLKPFVVVMITGWLAFFTGTQHLLAYMVQILNTYQSPISPNWATVSFCNYSTVFCHLLDFPYYDEFLIYAGCGQLQWICGHICWYCINEVFGQTETLSDRLSWCYVVIIDFGFEWN